MQACVERCEQPASASEIVGNHPKRLRNRCRRTAEHAYEGLHTQSQKVVFGRVIEKWGIDDGVLVSVEDGTAGDTDGERSSK